MRKESVRYESIKFFKSISLTISTCVQRVLHGMPSFIFHHTLEDFLHGGEPMKYESVVYMYGWIMEEHQPITFPQAEFAKIDIVHHLIDWNSKMSYFEEEGTDVKSQSSRSRRSRFNKQARHSSRSTDRRSSFDCGRPPSRLTKYRGL